MIIFLSYLFIFLAGIELFNAQEQKYLITVIIIVVFLSALFGLRQYFGGFEQTIEITGKKELLGLEKIQLKRIFGLTFSPDFFACMLATAFILLVGVFRELFPKEFKKPLGWILLGVLGSIFIFAILLTRSFGGILSFLIGIGTLVLLRWHKYFSLKKVIFLGLGMFLILAMVFSFFIYQRRATFFNPEKNPIILRLYNFNAGFKVYLEKPLTSVGLGCFWIAYPKYRPAKGNEIRYVHNNFIQILAETGPLGEIGLIIILVYFFTSLKKFLRKKDFVGIGVFSALVVIISHWLWDYGLYVPEIASIFFVLLSALEKRIADEEKPVPRSMLLAFSVIILLLWASNFWLFQEERLVKKSRQAFMQRDLEKAKQYAQKALKMIPVDDYAVGLLAKIAIRQKAEPKLVYEYYRRAIYLNPRFAFWHKELGDYYLMEGKLNQAEKEYKQALKLYPNKLEFLVRMASVKRLKGEFVEAEKFALRALEVSGDHRFALWELVWIYSAQEEPVKMKTTLEKLAFNYQDQWAKSLLAKFKNKKQ